MVTFYAIFVEHVFQVLPWKVLHTILVLLQAMQFGDTRTIFNDLIPNDPTCQQRGEYGCLCDWNQCNKTNFLECIDGKCACEFPLHRTFDEQLGRCVSLVGSYCGTGWAPVCTRNSECQGGRCTCREGYSRTMQNNCSLNYGEECGNRQCNRERGLACKNGVCTCLDSAYVYSAIHTVCIDPEAVVREIFQQLAQRIIQGIFNFKLRRAMNAITLPFRLVTRLALGPFG